MIRSAHSTRPASLRALSSPDSHTPSAHNAGTSHGVCFIRYAAAMQTPRCRIHSRADSVAWPCLSTSSAGSPCGKRRSGSVEYRTSAQARQIDDLPSTASKPAGQGKTCFGTVPTDIPSGQRDTSSSRLALPLAALTWRKLGNDGPGWNPMRFMAMIESPRASDLPWRGRGSRPAT